MNRIESAPKILSAESHTPSIPTSLSTRTVERIHQHGRDVTPHATFAPIHYEPGYAYPLVIWLHGQEGDEQQIRQIMPRLSMRNYVAIAPRGTCEIRGDEIGAGRRSYAWRQSADSIDEAESRVLDCIAIASGRFHVHTQRVFLAGVGCGGTMALRTAWNHPGRFAGVATFGGSLPSQNRPLRNVNALRSLPCFVATGRTSRQYPEATVCNDLRLLHSAGCRVALRQYPCGDELTTTMLEDLNRWMMELVCPQ
ncbi:MAG: alpha/beta hydrolase [Pirellulales bacterium]